MTFESFNLNHKIANRVKALGFTTPTPIQEQAIPSALEGRDIMGLAQTGTGKTAAFALPILERLLKGRKNTIRALVIAPTRELAEQITEDFEALGRRAGLRCTSIYGGVSQKKQVERLGSGTEIVVACPGRLLDLVNQGLVKLNNVEILVLDEADRMFDMGFLPDIRKIVSHLPRQKQVMLFSATMPKAIRALANDFMRQPLTIQIGHEAPVDTVSHALYPVKQHLKTDLLMEILQRPDANSVLIFTRTKHRAKRLDRHLKQVGYSAASLQGNLSQTKRQAAMDGFKNGTFQILVATDIAARGIDVSDISHVINYDIPDTPDAYTHRIGRTGRATKTGEAFTFVAPEDEGIVRSIERVIGMQVERRTIDGFDYEKRQATRIKSPNQVQARSHRQPSRKPNHQNGRRQGGPKHGQGAPKRGGRPQSNRSHRPRHSNRKYRGTSKPRYQRSSRNTA